MIEEDYSNCLKDIPDEEFNEEQAEACYGKDMIKVNLDIRYETMKILSRGDSTVREIMIDSCYIDAGEDEIKSNACDLLEKDVIDLIWSQLPFHELIKVNK